MTSQTEVDSIITIIRKAVSSSLNEQLVYVSIELKEFSKKEQIYNVDGTFKVTPFFTTRTGEFHVTLSQSEEGFEITRLRIEE